MKLTILAALFLAAAGSAAAQSFNLDVGANVTYGIPSASYAGAASQPGVWNSVPPTAGTTALFDVSGAATSVTVASTGGSAYESITNPGPTGDDLNLMADVSDPSFTGQTWTFTGLVAGPYILTTYVWPPDNPIFRSVITVAGSSDAPQTTGGSWPMGGHALGITYALHHVTVAPGGTIAMTITVAGGGSFASLNGFQLEPDTGATSFTPFCFPGQSGIITCPCNNPPTALGKGCNNFGAGPAVSAELTAAGATSISSDTLTLTSTGENNTSTTLFLQGPSTSSTGVPFGAGVRCATGSLKRLYAGQASAGTITRPQSADPNVHTRSAALGDPLSAGSIRYYFAYYRDPSASGPCSNAASTFNCSNAGRVTWAP